MRAFHDRTNQCRDRWDLLGLGSNGAVSRGGADSSNHAVHRTGARVARSGRVEVVIGLVRRVRHVVGAGAGSVVVAPDVEEVEPQRFVDMVQLKGTRI